MDLELTDVGKIITVSKLVFGRSFNEPLIHQVINAYLSRKRQGSKAQKSKSEVSGSGKKPWKQKGTGRARSGSLRSPIWRSGGVTFASKPKDYSIKVNKKMYKGAISSIFSELIRQNRLLIFKKFEILGFKTKFLLNKLKFLNIKNVLIILDKINKNLFLSSRNLHSVDILDINSLNPVSLISCHHIIITVAAIKKIEGFFI